MTKRFRLAVVAALLAAASPVWVQAQESEHRRAAETWKKKEYGQFIKHAENFIMLYPRHNYVPNLDFRAGKALGYLGKYPEAIERLYQVARKYPYSQSGLMALDDAKLMASAYKSQPEALKEFLKADAMKMHVSEEITQREHEAIKAQLEKTKAVKGLHGLLAAKVDYEAALVMNRELKREYMAYYPSIKPDLLIAYWETFETNNADSPYAFRGLVQRVKLYGWLAKPKGSGSARPVISFYDRGIAIADERLKTAKGEQERWLLLYHLAKLLKDKQYALIKVDSQASFNVLKRTMETYEQLLKEAPKWYLIVEVLADMVDLKCLVADYDGAYKFAYDRAKDYRGEPEYGKVFWTLFRFMTLNKSKYLLKKSLTVLKTISQEYGNTTYYQHAIEQYRAVKPLMDSMKIFVDEEMGKAIGVEPTKPKIVEVPEAVQKPKEKPTTFMTDMGKFIVISLTVIVVLTVLLFVAEKLRQKEEFAKVDEKGDDRL